MTKRLTTRLVLCLLLVSAAACQKKDGGAPGAKTESSAKAPAQQPPADAKTIAAFRAGRPEKGASAKIHGFVGSTKGNAWPLVDRNGDTLPFVFCKMASPPAGVASGAHVVAVGKVEDDAMLEECSLTPL